MAIKTKAWLAALILGTAAVPALAQAPAEEAPKLKISQGAAKAIAELQTAVKANNTAEIPAKLAAAQAVAKSDDDRYAVAHLRLQAAIASKDQAAIAAAGDALIATGRAPAELTNRLRLSAAQTKYQAKDYAGASAALEPIVAAQPNNADALALMADIRNRQNRSAEALEMFQKAIAARKAAGQPIPKDWNQRAVAIAYKAKLPTAGQLALDWVRQDPTPTNWRDAITIYSESNRVADADRLDVYRLQRAAGALKGENDYYTYANGASVKGLPGEAKAVLDEGFAANAISRSSAAFSQLYPAVSSKVAADKASLAGSERTALAGSAARPALVTGDAYLGYGEYAKAAALYRAALGKSGVDANVANLRLGIALARSGDKAGANAAFEKVGGQQKPVATLWQTWLATRA
jgi:tetratricopeptide (TPR) repeat protein